MSGRRIAAAGVGIAMITSLIYGARLDAHLTAVSPYTFHQDIQPILEVRCGPCHEDDSVSGLPLLRYEQARSMSWPIRQALAGGHMPPWYAEGAFKQPAPVTAHELNLLMTWATGGAPEGKPVARVSDTLRRDWPLGRPDVVIPLTAFAFASDRQDAVVETSVAARQLRGRMIREVDLMTGAPAMVRRAEVVERHGNKEQTIGLWQPGETAAALESNAAFRAPGNASIIVRAFYRKNSVQGHSEDRSQLGIYFAPAGARSVETIELSAPAVSRSIERPAHLVAVRPISGPSGASIRLILLGKNGSRRVFARVQLRDDWQRRYAFETPLTLERGDRIEVAVSPFDNDLWASLLGEMPHQHDASARIAIEFVR